ncbi:hypothetical protein Calow_2214 [Caldicellulosiruptor owensensis OL]|uniref:Tryptophan-rich sensory protein n=1 Tax=Caldicellulosiruptor owensensis (strain ATCC 700167 / DSM 13100 / OL) TaxID=632518 RepID=E4Q737_CALOW|nr:TspO/MBR family protein [Caldicellulosiruptor owensensis]ADQ05717.1 hypothetical protein Calow_2214 [Caldicellulosiruptor owensensis OL]
MERKRKAIISGVLLVITLIVNALGSMGIINGNSQKAVSDKYQTLITPSPSTFSIWGLIYLLLIISVALMIFKHNDDYFAKLIDSITYLFWLSCVLNIIWIVFFSYEMLGLATIVISGMLITLTLIVKNISKMQTQRKRLLPLTFGLYSGWLLIATVVNISAWLVKLRWNGLGISPEIRATVVLIISIALSTIIARNIKNEVFILPVAWAYFGIYNNLISASGFNNKFIVLPKIAIIGAAVLIAIFAIEFYKNKYCITPTVESEKKVK